MAETTGVERNVWVAAKPLFEFDRPQDAWRSIDDGVMGGLSSSRMRVEEGQAVFAGELSLENNGGFASVRSEPLASGLSGASGLTMRVRGDGRTYQFRIRTDSEFDGSSYQVEMTPPRGEWGVIDLPFSTFRLTFRGRELPDQPDLAPAKIQTMGVLIADKQEGPFRLDLDWIKAY